MRVARSSVWIGGSEAREVPCRASLAAGLKAMLREEKGRGVGEGVADDVVAGQGVDVVGGQVHHRAELPQFGEGGIGVR